MRQYTYTWRMLLSVAFTLLLAACGGGTDGTGRDIASAPSETEIIGVLLDQDRQPIARARLALRSNGESDYSDDAGRFELKNESVSEDVLVIDAGDINASITLPAPPDGALKMQIVVRLNLYTSEAVLISLNEVTE